MRNLRQIEEENINRKLDEIMQKLRVSSRNPVRQTKDENK